MTPNSPKKSTCLFGRWKMRTNSSPWSNHSYIGMILGWNVIRFKRAISTLTHWSLPFGSLCSFHFGIWNFILSTFKKYPLFKISQFSKCLLGTYFFLFDNFYGDWFFIGSFDSGKDLSKSATSNKFFFLIKTKVWSIFICVRERAPVNFFQILKNGRLHPGSNGTVSEWVSFGIGQFWMGHFWHGTVLWWISFAVRQFWGR